MTKEDYELIAEIIKETPSETVEYYTGFGKVIDYFILIAHLCRGFKADNPDFDEDKFRSTIYD